ncbi:MAG: type III-A CRISPR-associated RAMP protein Csm3 [Cryomorphaceae bacterium]|nr:type III-A CRISPR-associated RAMP protein Csm3 [Cryomorphaceae bacterium]
MSNQKKKLIGKVIISGTIEVMTGLAIGGNASGIEIGGMDNPVIKTYNGKPFIPGSSLKGKLRALLAKAAGSKSVKHDLGLEGDFKHLAKMFGVGAADIEERGEALLKVRDAYLKSKPDGAESFTEEKMENSINRVTGKANPRPHERVLPGTIFDMELCLDVYNEEKAEEHLKLIDLAFQLLNEDYLGGGGTRGNGRVKATPVIGKYLNIKEMKLEPDDSKQIVKYEFLKSNA